MPHSTAIFLEPWLTHMCVAGESSKQLSVKSTIEADAVPDFDFSDSACDLVDEINRGSEMAAQPARPAERGYHQDYIARIRYENPLPPPPGAPKLLNIPTEGLNYYCSAAFSSRLVRQQPLNIEADAELGMPIDLVGMPGIFDGDESCKFNFDMSHSISTRANSLHVAIQAPLAIPPVHPKDKNLLRPLSELGKPKFNPAGYSFLRRTEYISSDAKARAEANANAAKSAAKSAGPPKARKPADTSKDDPMTILRSAVKGFDLANPEDAYTGPDNNTAIRGAVPSPAETEAWKRPKHPSKPDVKLLDSYPLKPDLDATTDSGAYMVTKFTGNPTAQTKARDTRMDVGILYPVESTQVPGTYNYEFFLPPDDVAANKIKKKLDVNNPDRDDQSLYTHKDTDGSGMFKYSHLRTYELNRQTNNSDQQYREVALALHEPDGTDGLEKGAYYYPISTKMQLKPQRNKNLAQLGLASQTVNDEDKKVDALDLVIGEPDVEELASRGAHRDAVDPDLAEADGDA